MRPKLLFTDRAINDIVQAKAWYDKQQKGLGDKFTDTVFKSAAEIQLAPLGYPNKYKYTREKYIKKFPYLIIYSVEENIIFVLRVFSCKTNPKKKYRNIGK